MPIVLGCVVWIGISLVLTPFIGRYLSRTTVRQHRVLPVTQEKKERSVRATASLP
jgi:hypothetical protein